jgi:tetratricopeptide (TPR) repeat protein
MLYPARENPLRDKELRMLTHTRMAASLAAGVVLFSGLSLAQTGAFFGQVTGPDGNPYKGALVRIERIEVRGNYKVKSNKKGKYYHGGLPLGSYNVSVEIDGRIVDTVQNARVGTEGAELDFDLAAMARNQQQMRDQGGPNQRQLEQMTPEERREWEKFNQEKEEILSKNKKLNAAFNAGKQAYRDKDYQTAVNSFNEAAALEPEQHVVWANLALAEGNLALTKAGDERARILESCLSHYRKAIELDPESANYHNNLGLALAKNGRLEEGAAELEKAAALDPLKAGTYFFNLGAVMVNTNRTQEAISAFKKATEVQPDYALAYYQLATALVGSAKIKEDGSVEPVAGTVEAFQKYLELEPNGPYAAASQQMIQGLTTKVETEYEDPDRGKRKRRKRKSS